MKNSDQIKIKETEIQGIFVLEDFVFLDSRGAFTKKYNIESFEKCGLDLKIKEQYFTFSKKGTIRGMHFQLPPFEENKLIYVPKGEIIDVLLDLRSKSHTYGKHISIKLSEKMSTSIYIPEGIAHGYQVLSNDTIVIYLSSNVYSKSCYTGISWNSFGMKWPLTKNPEISEKDSTLVQFDQFESPF